MRAPHTPSRLAARTQGLRLAILAALLAAISGCASKRPVSVSPRGPGGGILEVREGLASYYGEAFHGRLMASGARFDMNALVAAHPTYPFGTVVRVTNVANGRAVELRILDRGPAAGPRADGVIIDVSEGAARALGFIRAGRARVRIEVLRWGTDRRGSR